MNYISPKEIAKKWNISERRVRELCVNGRIYGAYQVSGRWNIPTTAEKPVDGRVEKVDNQKTVLVTGASRGIGRAIAEKFLQQGYVVYGCYNNSLEPMKDIQKKYGKNNFKIVGPYDLTVTAQIEELALELSETKFDSLVLNAGIFSENDDFLNFDLNDFNKVMNCNFYSQLILAVKLQTSIKNGGSIVLMSSNDAYSGAFGSMSYSISKSAVISLMKCLSANFGRRQIRVNSVAPGAINTDMNTPEQEFEAPNWTPIERIAQPYEVAEVVYFLSDKNSSFINGENITIDGGYSNISILLKKEVSNSRNFVGYDYIIEKINSLQPGDIALCVDTTTDYGWVDNPDELKFLKVNIDAIKRGAVVDRIVITNDTKKKEFMQNEILRNYISDTLQSGGFSTLVNSTDLKKYNKSDFAKIGQGVLLFIKGNERELFFDNYRDSSNIGYVVHNDILSDSIYNSFMNIKRNIKSGKIKRLL